MRRIVFPLMLFGFLLFSIGCDSAHTPDDLYDFQREVIG